MDSSDELELKQWRVPNKSCFVPSCPNNDIKNSDKSFFPIRKELKDNWCQLVKRNIPKRVLFCCEDHINVEEDLENYVQFVAGAKPKLKLNATLKNIPNKLIKQPKSKTAKQIPNKPTSNVWDVASPSTSTAVAFQAPLKVDAAVQYESILFKSKTVTVKPKTADKGTNFRARQTKHKIKPSQTSHFPYSEESPSLSASLYGSSNVESSTSTGLKQDIEKYGRQHLLNIIKNKPKMYLGVPKHFWWVIDFISKEYSCPSLHIIVTLFKIKNNDSFIRMSEEFEMATSTIRLIFEKNVNILATYFQNFVNLPNPIGIKKNLPLVFKIRYSNVQCIIDCFEIQIEKPSDPVRQAQTWSQYKSCNTIKYLIGCTPAGLVSFVSKGFGGRISDKAITEKSGFVDILPLNAVIMADRGFKEIESLLSTKNVKLLRPPSVFQNTKLSKHEAIETKVIASLRIHVERVIRRVREFHMLKPHSVVNNKLIKYLDEIVIIACGLINLQDPIIKEY